MKKLFAILPYILLIQSCSTMSNKLDCPMKGGIRCESIDSINARVDRGEIGNGTHAVTDSYLSTISYHPSYPSSFNNGKPLRYGETVMRVWFAPFEDKQGNYHEESDIFTITKPGHWIGDPLKTTENEDI